MLLERKSDTCLKKNKYSDIIRMVYEDFFCIGLGTMNVEKVIKLVLEKVAGI